MPEDRNIPASGIFILHPLHTGISFPGAYGPHTDAVPFRLPPQDRPLSYFLSSNIRFTASRSSGVMVM